MVTAADRTQTVKEYYFSQKMSEIEQLNQNGKQVINLGIGNPDLPPPKQVLEALSYSCNTQGVHGYPGYKGIAELREEFALWYEKYFNVQLNPNNEILPLIGSKEGIMHVSMAFLNPGDEVLIPNPAYPVYRSVSQLLDAKISEYKLLEENNYYPDFEALEKQDLSNVKLMWTNYPNMPTGQAASPDLFKRLIAFAKKHKILIINDNPYSFILYDKPMSILNTEGAKEVALELNSLSKSHNMAGFRIGMIAGKADLIKSVLTIKSNADSGMYIPLQMAAVRALQLGSDWYENINTEYTIRRQYAEELFSRLGVSFDTSRKGMFLWGKIPQKYNDAMQFSDELLEKYRLFITPGTIFGTAGNRHLRISLCSNAEQFETSLQRIKTMKHFQNTISSFHKKAV